ncbi:DNA topoisomerase 2-binding protein 1-like isoform X2 [Physella acuta]|uniref:DNA topoisomerase 2-binding protein 1-like isoform X2 n=1 Tax=Physella acuta TaxID=109671 RepID=UPI0027DBB215|nr:DNA topoisomerase 2-binding protein 1-like isoform X2 [Physella acuta]
MEEDLKIYFVKPPKNEENNSTLTEAFETLRKAEFDLQPEWISSEDCLLVRQKGKHVYIFDQFKGEAFDHLKELGFRIYGPQCILANLLHGEELPRHRKKPIYNLAMKDVKICCTSLDKPIREEIMNLVLQMGGSAESDLTADSTHLVAGEVGSAKYLVAVDAGKQVMVKEWVYKVWEASKDRYIKATDDLFNKYTCPPFHGLTIVVSGFSSSERNNMRSFIIKGGGKYSGEMKMNQCTHLVVKEPKGAKFEAARSWQIKVVNDQWLFDCIDKQRYLDPNPYQFNVSKQRSDVKTSTPERRTSLGPNISDISAISNAGPNSSMLRVDETTDLTSTRMSSMFHSKHVTIGETRMGTTTVDGDTTITPADVFLDGCRIFLSGIKPAVEEKMRKIISAGGGLRATEITEGITHVVIGDVVLPHMTLINKLEESPHIVSTDWLMDCFHQNSHVNEEKYQHREAALTKQGTSGKLKKSNNKRAPSEFPRKDKNEDKNSNDVSSSKTSQAAGAFSIEAASDLEMAELLSQYMDPPVESRDTGKQKQFDTDSEVQILGVDLLKAGRASEQQKPSQEEELMTQDPNENEDVDGDRGIFFRKTFITRGFDEEETAQLKEFIEQKGGVVLQSLKKRQIPDIAIVPLLGFPVEVTVSEILTNAWLQMCMEFDSLLPYDDNWLSRPLELPENEPLSGCCVSVSGYVNIERECIMHLAQSLGANCQDHFARKSSKNVQASTHLIVNHPSGSKYEAAKKWKIPAVGKDWLLACIRSGRREAEDEYSIEAILEREERKLAELAEEKRSSSSSLPTPPKVNRSCVSDDVFVGEAVDTSKQSDKSGGRSASEDAGIGEQTTLDVAGVRRQITLEDAGVEGGMTEDAGVKGGMTLQEITLAAEAQEHVSASSSESCGPTAKPDAAYLPKLHHHLTTGQSSSATRDRKSACQPNQSENISAGLVKTPVSVLRQKWGENVPVNSPLTPLGLTKGGLETPGTFMQPGFRPKFNLDGLFDSPDVSVDLNKSTPLGEIFRRQITKAAQVATAQHSNTADVVDDRMPASQSQSDELAPLHGVVIAVAKKLGRSHEQYNSIVVELGGDYSWHIGPQVTHFVFQGRPNDINKEFRKARDEGKIIVSPYWLHACKEQNCRVDESLFPQNYNPNFSLTLTPGLKSTPMRSTRASAKTLTKSDVMAKCEAGPPVRTPANRMPVLNLEKVGQAGEQNKTKSDVMAKCEAGPPVKTPATKMPVLNLEKVGQAGEQNKTKSPVLVLQKVDSVSELSTFSSTTLEDVSLQRKETKDSDLMDENEDASKHQEMKEELAKTMGNILANPSRSKANNRKKGRRANLSGQMVSDSSDSDLVRSGNTSQSNKTAPLEPSQSLQITWDDPTERLEKVRLAHQLGRVSETSQNTEELMAAMDIPFETTSTSGQSPTKEKNLEIVKSATEKSSGSRRSTTEKSSESHQSPTPKAPPLAFPIVKPSGPVQPPKVIELLSDEGSDGETVDIKSSLVFLMSGLQNQERLDYSALVEKLGGRVVEMQHFDPSSTHLVIGQPARNEKFLSCVASGKWILHKSYFEACRKEGRFVEETHHEWGSEFTLPLMKTMTPLAKNLAAAAYKWRQKISLLKKANSSCKGAFDGWKVLLCLDKSKEENFQRLLEAGGAKVSTVRSPSTSLEESTHAFLDLNKIMLPQNDLERLIEAGVHCLKPEYIPAFLTDDPPPDPSEFYPAEVVVLKSRT